MVQFVFALEKASVAAAKRDISVVNGAMGSLLVPRLSDGISFGSCVEVMGAGCSISGGGVEGGVGGAWALGSPGDVIGALLLELAVFDDSVTERRFCNPLMFGTR